MCAAQVVLQALLLALVAAEEDSICETGMVLLQLTQNRLLKPAARLVQTATGTLSQPPPVVHHHRVEHVELLSQTPFWWMMAVVIVLVSIAIIRTDMEENRAERESKAEGKLGESSTKSSESTADISPAPETNPTREVQEVDGRKRKEMEMFYSSNSLRRLSFCFLALNASMILWGITQEFIMTNVYTGRKGQPMQIPSPLFLVLCNRVTAAAFSAMLLWVRGKPLFFTGCIDSLGPAVSNTVASWSQYGSLAFISFGLQTTAKSTKILPVVIISSLRGNWHSLTDYAECLVLTFSCFVFGHESEADTDMATTNTGVILLGIYILCDSLTPHLQDILFKKHPDIDVVQATLSMACFACGLMVIEMTITGQLFQSIGFVFECPEAILHMLVLSLASTVTQYMISFTIKHFGPVVYTLIASTRQVLSVIVSAILFTHHISGLSFVAMFIIFGTLSVRALRPLAKDHRELTSVQPEVFQHIPLLQFSEKLYRFSPLFVCTIAIHIVYLVYTIMQEFLSSHTFEADLFNFPLTLVALSHSAGALLSLFALRMGGHSWRTPGLWKALLPGSSDLVATSLQHAAIYKMFFPAQSLMKTLKVLPVMMVGSVLRNRIYSGLDYAEGLLLTCLVAFFVWDFQINGLHGDLQRETSIVGIGMMLGYLVVDSFTSNFQDHIYQTESHLEPGHMLLGMEVFSAALAWIMTLISGELPHAATFVHDHPEILLFLGIFAMTAAVGALACVLTVRLFGPAVFTLIMTSRAILSLLFSVILFQHNVAWEECLCLVVVCMVTLLSSTRRVAAQLRQLEQS